LPSDSPLLPSLLIHDGELADVAELLAHLGLQHVERRGAATEADEAQNWELVISTPKRLLEFDPGASGVTPLRMAVLEKESKTLRSMLQRAGTDIIVRRPVHPAALQLLVLHSLYRGPEKRRALRVSIGARIKFRSGLRTREAVLADLSTTGCRLLSAHPVAAQQGVKIQVPDEVAAIKAFSISGTVVRSTQSEFPGIETLAVRFGPLKSKHADQLRKTLAAFSGGPAALASGDAAAELAFREEDRREPPAGIDPKTARAAERRSSSRHAYAERITALGVEAARVLLGRDISLGGMRVESHPDVAVGDELRIGLHVRGREEPVEVNARVVRDDADRGSVLQFFDLDERTQDYLNRMVRFLPILAVREGNEDGVVVCEILEQHSEPPTAA
jgi:c-di-GMP-binding flagellar brake protein YcgR